jgi:lipoprotein NlpI
MKNSLSNRASARSNPVRTILLRRRLAISSFCWSVLVAPGPQAADVPAKSPDDLVTAAAQAFEAGRREESFTLLKRVIDANPNNGQGYFVRGRFYSLDHQPEKAIADFDQVVRHNPQAALAFQYRGEEKFKLGRIDESIADFDRYLELEPDARPQHWQRGIALYYAGRYDEGRRQFELHQTVNSSDVENAVWHFLCVARASDASKARASLIKIDEDSRVPMMQVYALFSGKGSADEVLAAARAGNPSPTELKQRLFFAHLYLGLYYEAMGDKELTRKNIFQAADEFRQDHYMGDVARVHAAMLRRGTQDPSPERKQP